MMMNKEEKRKYQLIYQNQCVYCYNEGTYKCELDIDNKKIVCKNYTTNKTIGFGGY